MLGNLQMNDHRITGLTNPPNNGDEAANKKYVDDNISKANLKLSHTMVMRPQIKNTLTIIFQKPILNYLIHQKMCFNISWMM